MLVFFSFIHMVYDVRLHYRYCLWILGNATTLLSSGSIWADLIRNAKDRGCFFNASSDKALSRVIAKQKSDLIRVEVKRNKPPLSSRNNRVWVYWGTFLPLSMSMHYLALDLMNYPSHVFLFYIFSPIWCIIILWLAYILVGNGTYGICTEICWFCFMVSGGIMEIYTF